MDQQESETRAYRQSQRSCGGPAWRWRQAIASSIHANVTEHDDGHIRDAADYLRRLTAGKTGPARAAAQYPLVSQAKSLWDTADQRQQFTIMALAGFPVDEMATRLGVTPEIVETVERLFFDVRDCRQASAWINSHVIAPESAAGNGELAVKYRHAYYGGPAVGKWLLDSRTMILDDAVDQIAAMEARLHLKLAAALEMPLTTTQEGIQFQRAALDYQVQSDKLQLDKEKFRAQSEQKILNLEIAERRQATAEKLLEHQIQTRQQDRRRQHALKRQRERLAALDETLRVQRIQSEREHRLERANRSPLAALTWTRSTGDRPAARPITPPAVERPVAA